MSSAIALTSLLILESFKLHKLIFLCNRLRPKVHTHVYPSYTSKWPAWKQEEPFLSWRFYNTSCSRHVLYWLWFVHFLNVRYSGLQQKSVSVINCREMFDQFDDWHLTRTLWKKKKEKKPEKQKQKIAVALIVFSHWSKFSACSWWIFNYHMLWIIPVVTINTILVP